MTDQERPHRRPPWWPADEPWPPQGRPRWRQGGRPPAFVRRLFLIIPLAILALFVLVVGASTLLFWLVASSLGWAPFHPRPPPLIRIGAFVIVVVVALLLAGTARALRRITTPVSDFWEAVERVADGDFA